MLLPNGYYFIKLFIGKSLEQVWHNEGQETLTQLRFRFWVIKDRKAVIEIVSKCVLCNNNNKKRSHTQLDSRKQVIAFQDRVITINIKEAQHPLK